MAENSEIQQELADSNRHIVEGHARIDRQRERMRQLQADGHDVTNAETLLRTMEEGLEAIQARRQHILRELAVAEDEQR
jgi:hypothetical protein